MSDEISADINQAKRDVFLHDYFNVALPHGSVSTILTHAFNALIAAGVVVLKGDAPHAKVTFDVHGGRVRLERTDPATGEITNTWWTPDGGMPSLDDAMDPIINLLVAIVGSPPWTGATDFPHSRN